MSWIIFTIAATILQTFRNLEQKSLNQKLDTLTVSWSRFILPLPFAIICVVLTFSEVRAHFILLCAVTAFFQIAGNAFLLKTIKSRNFSIGIAFYKTEILQSLILGLVFFNNSISATAFVAIVITSIGMVLMSNISWRSGKNFYQQFDKSALFGALSGLCFAISAFSLKAAAQELIDDNRTNFIAAVIVLMWVISLQNIFFAVVKSSQNRLRRDLASLFTAENKWSFLKTGALSYAGSVCWFSAYALGNVVYVKAIGQIELLLAVLISYAHLKERQSKSELAGITLTLIGISILIFFY